MMSNPNQARDMQKQYETSVEILKSLQQSIQAGQQQYTSFGPRLAKIAAPRTQYESQLAENMSVMDELKLLDSSAAIFKALGPVLVKQDLASAQDNVSKRLEYIQQEVKRLGQQQEALERERDQCKTKLDQQVDLFHKTKTGLEQLVASVNRDQESMGSAAAAAAAAAQGAQ